MSLPDVPIKDLEEMEALAVHLASLAGTTIIASFGTHLSIQYKTGTDSDTFRDPVSQLDRDIESLIRGKLAEKYPDHTVIGEEMDAHERPGDFIWVVDPIDGTTNFVNGFPIFACTIGVLYRHRPVIGAVWCSTSHALRPGVYHAHSGGKLHFEARELARPLNPEVRRGLCGIGNPGFRPGLPLDSRRTGSAAIECAFCAAGLLQLSQFQSPNIWDVAGGFCLVEAAGGMIVTSDGSTWLPFVQFEKVSLAPGQPHELRHWRRQTLIGHKEAVSGFLSSQ